MQNASTGLNGIDKPQNQFINGLPERLQGIRQRYCETAIAACCHCELYASLRRIFDLAGLLGISNLSLHETEFVQSIQTYRNSGDLTPACTLLSRLEEAASEAQPAGHFAWPPLPHIDNTPRPRPLSIHLLTAQSLDDYIQGYFLLKQHKIVRHTELQQLAGQLDASLDHIIAVDARLCAQQGVDAFEYIASLQQDNHTFILFVPEIDFNLRLLAARHDIMLVLHNPYDNGALIQALDKHISLREPVRRKILLISRDADMGAVLQTLVGATGMTLDIASGPSEKLLQQLAGNQYDLVLIDYFLEELYGHELARIIRLDDALASLPLVYLDTQTGIECDDHAVAVRADCRILDCYEPDQMAQALIDAVSQSACQRKLGRFMAGIVREHDNYRRAIDAHSIISMADITGRIIDVNQKFCEVSGYRREELIGQKHSIVNSGVHPRAFFADMWRTIGSGQTWRGEICNRKKDGSLYWVESTIVPLLDEHGRPYQFISARTEITRIKHIENRLRISEDRLLRSQSFANIGTWDWNIQSGHLYWSPRIAPLFGYNEGELETTYQNFLNAVHPDDRQSVIDAVNNCVYQGVEYQIEHRCVWPSGEIRWLLERGDVVRDANGRPFHMLGVVMDINDRKMAELESTQQKRLLNTLRIGLSWYLEEHDLHQVSNFLLENLLLLTDSPMGMIGGIYYDEQQQPYLKVHAVSNVAWGQEGAEHYAATHQNNLEFHNLNNLLGEVIKTGKPVISAAVNSDPRRGGLPPGHPPLHAYLGVPVFHGDKLVAMYALANRSTGYNEDIIEFLKPFNVTYSAIMQASQLLLLQRKTLDELQQSRIEAINANQAKSQFLSSMSHELRTPLNSILGFSQLLEMNLDKNLTSTQRDNVHEIYKAGNHLLELINQVLDLARIESGNIELSIEPVMILPALLECVETISPLAGKRNIDIHWCFNGKYSTPAELNETRYSVSADRLRLKQVMLNFLSNAVKYNRDHGQITVCVNEQPDDEMIRISIKDTGKGIPADKQARLFHAFDRLGEEGGDIEGTGIGLVITRNLVERMEGKIGFHSVENSGSEFWVDFPAKQKQTSPESAIDLTGIYNTPALNGHTAKRIIYIEDNPANLRLIENILGAVDGIQLMTAHEPYLGLELIRTHKPDLIMMDINLPGLNGYELFSLIRCDNTIQHIPVIAISANAMPDDMEKGRNAGFNAYITKPIVVRHLLDTLNHFLNTGGKST